MSLSQASELVRSLSGEYPVCIVTSPAGAAMMKKALEGCCYIVNGVEMELIVDNGCKPESLFLLRKEDRDKYKKARGLSQ